ncbi:MAG: proline--tRNA ligase, partial [Chloroflexi bacterium]|nr:proline--tRNA ligase [Chloroflexota bacterium]
LNDRGEDTLVLCDGCRYAANAEAATLAKGQGALEPVAEMARVATPGTTTIEAVARYLGVETRQTLKAVFYSTPSGEPIFVVIRGDLEVNEAKLSALIGDVELRPATEESLRGAGLVPGYASPVGVSGVRIIADGSIALGRNYVAGANEPGYHLTNVNYPRDFAVDTIADIALARDGDPCPRCHAPLRTARGIEVGHVFKLGAKYSEAVGATFLDQDGVAKPVVMGSYGIGLGRLMACIIEQHHDEHGILWPLSVAPLDVHLVSLGAAGSAVGEAAEALYERLLGQGYEVLYDDRDETPGVKFNDADLIGAPVRLTVSRRTVEQAGVELKLRWESERRLIPDAEVEAAVRRALG